MAEVRRRLNISGRLPALPLSPQRQRALAVAVAALRGCRLDRRPSATQGMQPQDFILADLCTASPLRWSSSYATVARLASRTCKTSIAGCHVDRSTYRRPTPQRCHNAGCTLRVGSRFEPALDAEALQPHFDRGEEAVSQCCLHVHALPIEGSERGATVGQRSRAAQTWYKSLDTA